jgi:hypothetical protein
VIAHYEQRAAAHAARAAAERRISTRIARWRLATFIPGAACLTYTLFARGFFPAVVLTAGLALMAVFAVLVVWHARVEERVDWYDALHAVNQFAMARIGRVWDRLPPTAGPPAAIEHHPYALDLDLFGRASLLQWLGPPATLPGADALQTWLLHPASPSAVTARQAAVAELAPALEWREHLAAHGRLVSGVRQAEFDAFLRWAESPGPFSAAALRRLRAAVVTTTASIWLLILLHSAGAISAAWWLVPITLGMILSFATARWVHGEFNSAIVGEHAFERYAGLFIHVTAAPSRSAMLADIQSRLGAQGHSAPACMRRLMRILGLAQLRAGAAIFHFIFQALTLWDFYVFFALDSWRRDVGHRVRGWMAAVGDLDALSAFAHVRQDNPAWCFPELHAAGDGAQIEIRGTALGHPLIPDDRRVANDVVVGPPGTLLLITGSNMSGKSTLLRAIGLNTVLAQAGAPVCATHMSMPAADLETSLRVQDSLEHGLSYFMAALARLKGILERARRSGDASSTEDGRVVLYLLDEILQGTNTAERAIAVRGVARHLLEAGAIGVMTTHDLALAGEPPLSRAARLVHFTEILDEHGHMTFDYRLRPGLATSRNALRLMQLIGMNLEE